MDNDTFEAIKNKTKINYLASNVNIQTLTKQNIAFKHCISLSFKIENKKISHSFYVTYDSFAERYGTILGFDFFKCQRAILDISTNVLHLPKMEIPLTVLDTNEKKNISNANILTPHQTQANNERHINVLGNQKNEGTNNTISKEPINNNINIIEIEEAAPMKCTLQRKITLQPHEEAWCQLSYKINNISTSTAYFEKNITNPKLEINNALVQINPNKCLIIPVMNNSDSPLHLNKGMIIGKLCSIIHPEEEANEISQSTPPVGNHSAEQSLFGDGKDKAKKMDVSPKRVCVLSSDRQQNPGEHDLKGEKVIFDKQTTEHRDELNLSTGNEGTINPEMLAMRKEEFDINNFDLNHLNEEYKQKVSQLLKKNYAVFSTSYKTLGYSDIIKPHLNLNHTFAISCKNYPIPFALRKSVQTQIDELLQAGIIEESSSEFNFPIVWVRKRNKNGSSEISLRPALDLRLLNQITTPYLYELPKIKEILNNMAGKKWYSLTDLKSAFLQQYIPSSMYDKFAFTALDKKYQFKRSPFGACNSSAIFAQLMDHVFSDIKEQGIAYFLDDILISADSEQQMLNKLQLVFDKLAKFNLTLDPQKTTILVREAKFLGFHLSEAGIGPSPINVKKLVTFPRPNNLKTLKSFIGSINYFRSIIPNFAEIIFPLTEMTKTKNKKFEWRDECEKAFKELQDKILSEPVVKPIDFDKELILITDASKISISGILGQYHDDQFHPVEFWSKKLSNTEKNYSALKRELFAIYSAVKNFELYLYGRKFTILTDAKSLTYHISLQSQSELTARWILYLQQYKFDIRHIIGSQNPADYYSRCVFQELPVLDLNDVDTHSHIVNNVLAANPELSMANIAQLQETDRFCSDIRDKINNRIPHIISKYYVHKDTDILMRKDSFKNRVKTRHQIVLPKALNNIAIKIAHTTHFGHLKTYKFLRKYYFWVAMFKDVKIYCASCVKCLTFKSRNITPQPIQLMEKDAYPGQILSIDLVGKLPRSANNEFYILTILDFASRYLELIPLKNITSYHIIKALNNYVTSFGIPQTIISDNGSQMTGQILKNWMLQLGIDHRYTSIYKPSSNGRLERAHRDLKSGIACMIDQTCEWNDRLQFYKLWHNASINRATGYAPATLFLGRDITTPFDLNFPTQNKTKPYADYVDQIQEHIQAIHELAKQNQNKIFQTETQKNDKGRVRSIEIGDTVFMKTLIPKGTFQAKHVGPAKVIRKFRNDNYLIEFPDNKIIKIHIDKIFKVPTDLIHTPDVQTYINNQNQDA